MWKILGILSWIINLQMGICSSTLILHLFRSDVFLPSSDTEPPPTPPTTVERQKLRREASRSRPTELQPWFRTGFSRQQVRAAALLSCLTVVAATDMWTRRHPMDPSPSMLAPCLAGFGLCVSWHMLQERRILRQHDNFVSRELMRAVSPSPLPGGMQVIETLQDCPSGTFIVRDSSRAGHYALSVVGADHKTVHMLIVPIPAGSNGGVPGYKLGEKGTDVYQTVYELVNHFIENPQRQAAQVPARYLAKPTSSGNGGLIRKSSTSVL